MQFLKSLILVEGYLKPGTGTQLTETPPGSGTAYSCLLGAIIGNETRDQ